MYTTEFKFYTYVHQDRNERTVFNYNDKVHFYRFILQMFQVYKIE